MDFYDQLLKHDFTLHEWDAYCLEHPEYLTINNDTTGQVANALEDVIDKHGAITHKPTSIEHTSYFTTGIANILDLKTPLEILKEKLTRDKIIQAQRQELRDIYDNCPKISDTSTDKLTRDSTWM
jgi:hypothetical protein